MKQSEIFWLRLWRITYGILLVVSIWIITVAYDYCKDISVPVTVTGKYATGYHTKNSMGEHYYIDCTSKTYGSMAINVSYETYIDLKVSETTVFKLDKRDIDMYSTCDSNQTNGLIVIGLMLATFVFGYLIYLIGEFIVMQVIPRINFYLDNRK